MEYNKGTRILSFKGSETQIDIMCVASTACEEINPDNPLAAARSIKDMYEALNEIYNAELNADTLRILAPWFDKVETILRKTEGK